LLALRPLAGQWCRRALNCCNVLRSLHCAILWKPVTTRCLGVGDTAIVRIGIKQTCRAGFQVKACMSPCFLSLTNG
jgi:hypothetical protein